MKIVVLDNVRSAHNVGSIFRTAEGAGVEKIFLCGYTPTPIDRFGREVAEIKKTSLGASAMVAWERADDAPGVIRALHDAGVTTVAVEQTSSAISIYDFKLPANVAYIFGNEIDGVGAAALRAAAQHLHIPMAGRKESLNVSVCAGIILFIK